MTHKLQGLLSEHNSKNRKFKKLNLNLKLYHIKTYSVSVIRLDQGKTDHLKHTITYIKVMYL